MVRMVSLLIGLGLLATACAPAAPSPTAAPSKPTEAPKPAAPAAAPAASPAAAAPAVPAQPAAATSAPAAAPGKLDTVTYSIPSPNGFHMPILVGVDQQVFEKRGIKVDMVASGSSGVAMTQAVLGGSLHFAPVTIATALAAQAKEPDLMMIMGQFVGVPYSIMTPPEIKSVQELKGKTAGAAAGGLAAGWAAAAAGAAVVAGEAAGAAAGAAGFGASVGLPGAEVGLGAAGAQAATSRPNPISNGAILIMGITSLRASAPLHPCSFTAYRCGRILQVLGRVAREGTG